MPPGVCGLSTGFPVVSPTAGQDPPRVTHPSATGGRSLPSDLHVLGAPPAFVLSQDQTLHDSAAGTCPHLCTRKKRAHTLANRRARAVAPARPLSLFSCQGAAPAASDAAGILHRSAQDRTCQVLLASCAAGACGRVVPHPFSPTALRTEGVPLAT